MDSEWLQYEALGLLALVLGAVGLWLRGYLSGQQKRSDESDQWMRDLVKADIEERKATAARLDALVQASIEAQKQVHVTLGAIEKENSSHDTVSRMQHDEILGATAGYDAAAQGRYQEILRQVERSR